MKMKEEKIKNEKIKKDNEYLKYSYSPIINRNSSYMNIYKIKNNTINTSKSKISNNSQKMSKSKANSTINIYERTTKWKNLVEAKNKKLKNNLDNKVLNDSNCCFTPNLNKSIMETDISFIGKNIIEYETFLDKYNYKKYKKKLDTRINEPPKHIYQKKFVVEFISDSNCPTNSGTIKLSFDKRPINEIHKNREKLKINDFFERNIKLQSDNFFKENNNKNNNDYFFLDINQNTGKDGLKYYLEHKKMINRNENGSLSFFNAVNSIINKIN